MFYTMEEAAIIGGFQELYLDRDSVDPAVRERHRKFRQGLLGGALERADYEWAAAVLGFLRPQWWQEHEDHRALENALLKTRTVNSTLSLWVLRMTVLRWAIAWAEMARHRFT